MRVGMRGLMVGLVLAGAGGAELAAQEGRSEWVARAEALVRDLEAGRFGEAESRFAPEVRTQLDSARLAGVWTQITMVAGALGELTPRTDTVEAGNHLVELDAAFERQSLLVRVVMAADGQVIGFWFLPPGSGSSDGAREAGQGPPYADPARIVEEETTVGREPWKLPATLTLPAGEAAAPVVVLVHGSGPQDRDETIGPNKPFRDLAWGLASRGVGVLRYEKRTKEHGPRITPDITVEQEVIEDALLAIEAARSHPRTDGVFLLGHSLGGMLAPEIAVRDGGLKGVILLAGTNRRFTDVLEEQLTYIGSLPSSGGPEAQARLKPLLDSVAQLRARELPPDAGVMGAPASYIYDLEARDPLGMVQRVTVPVLVLQGGRDYQVTEEDLARWREALAGRGDVATRLYPDLNHLFMIGEGKATPEEYGQAGHVAEKVIEDLAMWAKEGRLPAR